MSYFDQKDKIANQPTQYGQLLNIPANKGEEAFQLWIEQPNGRMYHRGGNGEAAINDTLFKRFLDTDDLSAAGVVAGDVSNPDSWWVKLGGMIPLIIQGGKYKLAAKNYTSFSFPIKATSVLSMQAQLSLGSPVTFAIMITGITNSTFTLYCDTPGGKTVHVIAICI